MRSAMSCAWRVAVAWLASAWLSPAVQGKGLLILYRPTDVSNACAFSTRLRYDLSFGMGMSDTLTLVLRTLNEIDYECDVEVVSNVQHAFLLAVLRYPTTAYSNCLHNPDAFMLLKRWRCIRICDLMSSEPKTSYFTFAVRDRLRLRFTSNSSINVDINADMYQITITTARRKPALGCNNRNETVCVIGFQQFCFTSGVVCDGINNCGVLDWFDERKSQCTLPVDSLDIAPVLAVFAGLCCVGVACGHLLLRCLPPLAKSFFIFNANEDNRLCIDPTLVPAGGAPDVEPFKRISIIPVSSSSSSESKAMDNVESAASVKVLESIGSVRESKSTPKIVTPQEAELPARSRTAKSIADRMYRFASRFSKTQSKNVLDT